ncbi:MAG: tRNA (adenosine(37)-N6)-threonylcarbamoyltransferase complex ATPase subunit type 1 TsaE [Acidimicrobiaceae bacterium]|nr:tRNA (adenosine(37)-N6)-threonylcarbamoyltransferase complex ATPase subunit type 1 TsaE [Acidimicrobiaceae bacterium]
MVQSGDLISVTSHCLADTEEIGSLISDLVVAGDVIELRGELGVGKTAFARGLARGLGIDVNVASPTFLISRRYLGRLTLLHCDLYRLSGRFEVEMLGIDEEIEDGAVALLEWGEIAEGSLGSDGLVVRLHRSGTSEDEREISFELGQDWAPRRSELASVADRRS